MKPKIIGLTGGIGSGKTTIAKYFESLGVPVYIADDEAKKILVTDAASSIKKVFGEEVFTDGIPDRKKLSAVVFNDAEKLQQLNSIIHPAVKQNFEQWAEDHKGKKFVIKEAAILFESGSYKDCDAVILVTAPEQVRLKRVVERDGADEQDILKRMQAQWSDEKKQSMSNYIIENTDLNLAKKKAYDIYINLNE